MPRPRRPVREETLSKAARQSYHVTRTGSRGQARITPDNPDTSSAAPQLRLQETTPSVEAIMEQMNREFDFDERAEPAQTDPTPVCTEDDSLRAELEEQVGDSADTFIKPPRSGKGQNEMLQDWMETNSQDYLRELYMQYAPPDPDGCLCAAPSNIRFRCDDCLAHCFYCSNCIADVHRATPCHRISVWTGDAWSRTTLSAHGLVTAFGRHRGTCVRTQPITVLVGDLTGFHELRVTYCRCANSSEPYVQLLHGGMMPCSTKDPKSAFTIRALRFYSFLASDAKLSCSRYNAVLQRQSNNIEPQYHPDRLRELLRTTRQWDHLQLLKRAGKTTTSPNGLGSLAIRCPACPKPNINFIERDITPGIEYLFAYLLSYDGSFQLIRKNKAFDQFDTCLSDGLLYWVQQAYYRDHLVANKDTAYDQSTRGEDRCNNHRAANEAWVRQSGVAETGLGAVTCARHTFFMPQGSVNYWKGERYTYTDYAIAMVIFLLMLEGTNQIGVFYDIFCQWHKNFWERAPHILLPEGQLERPTKFFGGVPKYHLAGHIDSCYARYSLNNMHGVGRLDAEGCERGWANINGASGSTSEKGPGSRIDSINHCMNDWNWRKYVSMISFLVKAYTTAIRLAKEQEEAWQGFHEFLNPKLTRAWENMSTEPELVNGIWTITSRLRTVLDLNTVESARTVQGDTVEPGFTAPSWISEGLDIEKIQAKIRNDVKEYGNSITDRQSLDLYNRRVSLSSRISTHRNNAALFIDLTLTSHESLPSLAEETDGQPEHAALYLPSHLLQSVSNSGIKKKKKGKGNSLESRGSVDDLVGR
ncbi:hypothetical protein FRC11_009183, partial [Ceratobasidium sp. 423]